MLLDRMMKEDYNKLKKNMIDGIGGIPVKTDNQRKRGCICNVCTVNLRKLSALKITTGRPTYSLALFDTIQ